MEKKDDFHSLFKSYLDGHINKTDYMRLVCMIQELSDEELESIIFSRTYLHDATVYLSKIKSEKLYQRIKAAHLGKDFNQSHDTSFIEKFKRIWIPLAAACTIFLVSLIITYKIMNNEDRRTSEGNQAMIIPGKPKGNLLLDNGNELNLENLPADTSVIINGYTITKNKYGEITYLLNDSSITEQRFNTLITPKGGEYCINLPDGSKIWVNADSKIKYPINNISQSREVELQGEAFFEIATLKIGNNNIPFNVISGNQRIEVLGTSFNVNSYSNNKISTTLVEGKVKITFSDIKEEYLNTNDHLEFNSTENKIQRTVIDPFYITAWKNGSFAFDRHNLKHVMDVLSRWYDVDVLYQRKVSDIEFTGTISKYENIEDVLNLIKLTGDVTFNIKGRRIIVM